MWRTRRPCYRSPTSTGWRRLWRRRWRLRRRRRQSCGIVCGYRRDRRRAAHPARLSRAGRPQQRGRRRMVGGLGRGHPPAGGAASARDGSEGLSRQVVGVGHLVPVLSTHNTGHRRRSDCGNRRWPLANWRTVLFWQALSLSPFTILWRAGALPGLSGARASRPLDLLTPRLESLSSPPLAPASTRQQRRNRPGRSRERVVPRQKPAQDARRRARSSSPERAIERRWATTTALSPRFTRWTGRPRHPGSSA